MAASKAEFEQNALALKELAFKVSIVGNTTAASIKTYADGSILVYHENDTRTVTAVDSDIGFALTDLENGAVPAVIGVLIPVGDAEEIVEITVPSNGIVNTSLTGAMTAGVATKKGASSTGVTASDNIAFTLSCTGLDIDEDVATTPNCTFWVKVKYRTTQPKNIA
jgi:hypothetical protein